jgi:hypothetical protein
MEPQRLAARHVDFEFRLAWQDRFITRVALQAGACASPRLHGLVGWKGAPLELIGDALGRGVHVGREDYHGRTLPSPGARRRALSTRPGGRPAVAEPGCPAHARAEREGLAWRKVIQRGLDGWVVQGKPGRHTPRTLSATLVLPKPLTHLALDQLIGHACSLRLGRAGFGQSSTFSSSAPRDRES